MCFRSNAEYLVQTKTLFLEFLLEREHGRARILTGRFRSCQVQHRFLVRIHRLAHCVRTLLQAVSRVARLRNLCIQTKYAIDGGARVHRDLPFLPGNIQIDRSKILSRSSLLRQKWN